MFWDIIKKITGVVYRILFKMNPLEKVARADVNIYLKLGRQPAGKPLV